jgi:release factor H-coupled RctB family protein
MGKSPSGSRATEGGRITHYFNDAACIDGRATQQLAGTADLPGMVAVAGYPDLHPGRNGPVGAAFLADRLFPSLVGNDIGCGMALFTLDLAPRKLSLDKAARRLRALEGEWNDAPEARGWGFGTIGGGNHFCEVQSVEMLTDTAAALGLAKDRLCLLVQSGLRGLGESTYRRTEGLPSLDPDSAEGRAYLADHDRAVKWAAANRMAIASREARATNADVQLVADTPHNLLVQADGAWLHRKGRCRYRISCPARWVTRQFQLPLGPDGRCGYALRLAVTRGRAQARPRLDAWPDQKDAWQPSDTNPHRTWRPSAVRGPRPFDRRGGCGLQIRRRRACRP